LWIATRLPPQSLEQCSTIYGRAALLTWRRNRNRHAP
jgi:hypothetical protein